MGADEAMLAAAMADDVGNNPHHQSISCMLSLTR
jgi:hypothetical protein